LVGCRWQELKAGGKEASINPVPDEEKGDEDDPVGLTISKVKAGEQEDSNSSSSSSSSGSGKKEKRGSGNEFGTQGKGFGFGIQEWKKNHPPPNKKWV